MKKIKRTHIYVQHPDVYDIICPNKNEDNFDHKIDWSDLENHIWCYECNDDIFLPDDKAGIFSGPIPVGISKMLGISFDRINIETKEIVKCPKTDEDFTEYNKTWQK